MTKNNYRSKKNARRIRYAKSGITGAQGIQGAEGSKGVESGIKGSKAGEWHNGFWYQYDEETGRKVHWVPTGGGKAVPRYLDEVLEEERKAQEQGVTAADYGVDQEKWNKANEAIRRLEQKGVDILKISENPATHTYSIQWTDGKGRAGNTGLSIDGVLQYIHGLDKMFSTKETDAAEKSEKPETQTRPRVDESQEKEKAESNQDEKEHEPIKLTSRGDWTPRKDAPSAEDVALCRRVANNLNHGWADALRKIASVQDDKKRRALFERAVNNAFDIYRRAFVCHGDGGALDNFLSIEYETDEGGARQYCENLANLYLGIGASEMRKYADSLEALFNEHKGDDFSEGLENYNEPGDGKDEEETKDVDAGDEEARESELTNETPEDAARSFIQDESNAPDETQTEPQSADDRQISIDGITDSIKAFKKKAASLRGRADDLNRLVEVKKDYKEDASLQKQFAEKLIKQADDLEKKIDDAVAQLSTEETEREEADSQGINESAEGETSPGEDAARAISRSVAQNDKDDDLQDELDGAREDVEPDLTERSNETNETLNEEIENESSETTEPQAGTEELEEESASGEEPRAELESGADNEEIADETADGDGRTEADLEGEQEAEDVADDGMTPEDAAREISAMADENQEDEDNSSEIDYDNIDRCVYRTRILSGRYTSGPNEKKYEHTQDLLKSLEKARDTIKENQYEPGGYAYAHEMSRVLYGFTPSKGLARNTEYRSILNAIRDEVKLSPDKINEAWERFVERGINTAWFVRQVATAAFGDKFARCDHQIAFGKHKDEFVPEYYEAVGLISTLIEKSDKFRSAFTDYINALNRPSFSYEKDSQSAKENATYAMAENLGRIAAKFINGDISKLTDNEWQKKADALEESWGKENSEVREKNSARYNALLEQFSDPEIVEQLKPLTHGEAESIYDDEGELLYQPLGGGRCKMTYIFDDGTTTTFIGRQDWFDADFHGNVGDAIHEQLEEDKYFEESLNGKEWEKLTDYAHKYAETDWNAANTLKRINDGRLTRESLTEKAKKSWLEEKLHGMEGDGWEYKESEEEDDDDEEELDDTESQIEETQNVDEGDQEAIDVKPDVSTPEEAAMSVGQEADAFPDETSQGTDTADIERQIKQAEANAQQCEDLAEFNREQGFPTDYVEKKAKDWRQKAEELRSQLNGGENAEDVATEGAQDSTATNDLTQEKLDAADQNEEPSQELNDIERKIEETRNINSSSIPKDADAQQAGDYIERVFQRAQGRYSLQGGRDSDAAQDALRKAKLYLDAAREAERGTSNYKGLLKVALSEISAVKPVWTGRDKSNVDQYANVDQLREILRAESALTEDDAVELINKTRDRFFPNNSKEAALELAKISPEFRKTFVDFVNGYYGYQSEKIDPILWQNAEVSDNLSAEDKRLIALKQQMDAKIIDYLGTNEGDQETIDVEPTNETPEEAAQAVGAIADETSKPEIEESTPETTQETDSTADKQDSRDEYSQVINELRTLSRNINRYRNPQRKAEAQRRLQELKDRKEQLEAERPGNSETIEDEPEATQETVEQETNAPTPKETLADDEKKPFAERMIEESRENYRQEFLDKNGEQWTEKNKNNRRELIKETENAIKALDYFVVHEDARRRESSEPYEDDYYNGRDEFLKEVEDNKNALRKIQETLEKGYEGDAIEVAEWLEGITEDLYEARNKFDLEQFTPNQVSLSDAQSKRLKKRMARYKEGDPLDGVNKRAGAEDVDGYYRAMTTAEPGSFEQRSAYNKLMTALGTTPESWADSKRRAYEGQRIKDVLEKYVPSDAPEALEANLPSNSDISKYGTLKGVIRAELDKLGYGKYFRDEFVADNPALCSAIARLLNAAQIQSAVKTFGISDEDATKRATSLVNNRLTGLGEALKNAFIDDDWVGKTAEQDSQARHARNLAKAERETATKNDELDRRFKKWLADEFDIDEDDLDDMTEDDLDLNAIKRVRSIVDNQKKENNARLERMRKGFAAHTSALENIFNGGQATGGEIDPNGRYLLDADKLAKIKSGEYTADDWWKDEQADFNKSNDYYSSLDYNEELPAIDVEDDGMTDEQAAQAVGEIADETPGDEENAAQTVGNSAGAEENAPATRVDVRTATSALNAITYELNEKYNKARSQSAKSKLRAALAEVSAWTNRLNDPNRSGEYADILDAAKYSFSPSGDKNKVFQKLNSVRQFLDGYDSLFQSGEDTGENVEATTTPDTENIPETPEEAAQAVGEIADSVTDVADETPTTEETNVDTSALRSSAELVMRYLQDKRRTADSPTKQSAYWRGENKIKEFLDSLDKGVDLVEARNILREVLYPLPNMDKDPVFKPLLEGINKLLPQTDETQDLQEQTTSDYHKTSDDYERVLDNAWTGKHIAKETGLSTDELKQAASGSPEIQRLIAEYANAPLEVGTTAEELNQLTPRQRSIRQNKADRAIVERQKDIANQIKSLLDSASEPEAAAREVSEQAESAPTPATSEESAQEVGQAAESAEIPGDVAAQETAKIADEEPTAAEPETETQTEEMANKTGEKSKQTPSKPSQYAKLDKNDAATIDHRIGRFLKAYSERFANGETTPTEAKRFLRDWLEQIGPLTFGNVKFAANALRDIGVIDKNGMMTTMGQVIAKDWLIDSPKSPSVRALMRLNFANTPLGRYYFTAAPTGVKNGEPAYYPMSKNSFVHTLQDRLGVDEKTANAAWRSLANVGSSNLGKLLGIRLNDEGYLVSRGYYHDIDAFMYGLYKFGEYFDVNEFNTSWLYDGDPEYISPAVALGIDADNARAMMRGIGAKYNLTYGGYAGTHDLDYFKLSLPSGLNGKDKTSESVLREIFLGETSEDEQSEPESSAQSEPSSEPSEPAGVSSDDNVQAQSQPETESESEKKQTPSEETENASIDENWEVSLFGKKNSIKAWRKRIADGKAKADEADRLVQEAKNEGNKDKEGFNRKRAYEARTRAENYERELNQALKEGKATDPSLEPKKEKRPPREFATLGKKENVQKIVDQLPKGEGKKGVHLSFTVSRSGRETQTADVFVSLDSEKDIATLLNEIDRANEFNVDWSSLGEESVWDEPVINLYAIDHESADPERTKQYLEKSLPGKLKVNWSDWQEEETPATEASEPAEETDALTFNEGSENESLDDNGNIPSESELSSEPAETADANVQEPAQSEIASEPTENEAAEENKAQNQSEPQNNSDETRTIDDIRREISEFRPDAKKVARDHILPNNRIAEGILDPTKETPGREQEASEQIYELSQSNEEVARAVADWIEAYKQEKLARKKRMTGEIDENDWLSFSKKTHEARIKLSDLVYPFLKDKFAFNRPPQVDRKRSMTSNTFKQWLANRKPKGKLDALESEPADEGEQEALDVESTNETPEEAAMSVGNSVDAAQEEETPSDVNMKDFMSSFKWPAGITADSLVRVEGRTWRLGEIITAIRSHLRRYQAHTSRADEAVKANAKSSFYESPQRNLADKSLNRARELRDGLIKAINEGDVVFRNYSEHELTIDEALDKTKGVLSDDVRETIARLVAEDEHFHSGITSRSVSESLEKIANAKDDVERKSELRSLANDLIVSLYQGHFHSKDKQIIKEISKLAHYTADDVSKMDLHDNAYIERLANDLDVDRSLLRDVIPGNPEICELVADYLNLENERLLDHIEYGYEYGRDAVKSKISTNKANRTRAINKAIAQIKQILNGEDASEFNWNIDPEPAPMTPEESAARAVSASVDEPEVNEETEENEATQEREPGAALRGLSKAWREKQETANEAEQTETPSITESLEPEPESETLSDANVPETVDEDEQEENERYANRGEDGYYSIDEDAAKRAQEANSFREYKPNTITNDYRALVDDARKVAEEQKKKVDPMYHERIDSILNRYERELANWYNKWSRNQASYPSWMITGRSNYNWAKNKRKSERTIALSGELEKIQDLLSDVKSVGTGGISSDDSNAVVKIENKIARLKDLQEKMKEANKYWRKNQTWEGYDGPLQISDYDRRRNRPFTFELSNNNAEIRRNEKRLQQLKATQGANFGDDVPFDGGVVHFNKEANRIQLKFDDKPDAETISKLKSNGFKWAPREKAWQRMLNGNGIYAAKSLGYLPEDYKAKKGEEPAPTAPEPTVSEPDDQTPEDAARAVSAMADETTSPEVETPTPTPEPETASTVPEPVAEETTTAPAPIEKETASPEIDEKPNVTYEEVKDLFTGENGVDSALSFRGTEYRSHVFSPLFHTGILDKQGLGMTGAFIDDLAPKVRLDGKYKGGAKINADNLREHVIKPFARLLGVEPREGELGPSLLARMKENLESRKSRLLSGNENFNAFMNAKKERESLVAEELKKAIKEIPGADTLGEDKINEIVRDHVNSGFTEIDRGYVEDAIKEKKRISGLYEDWQKEMDAENFPSFDDIEREDSYFFHDCNHDTACFIGSAYDQYGGRNRRDNLYAANMSRNSELLSNSASAKKAYALAHAHGQSSLNPGFYSHRALDELVRANQRRLNFKEDAPGKWTFKGGSLSYVFDPETSTTHFELQLSQAPCQATLNKLKEGYDKRFRYKDGVWRSPDIQPADKEADERDYAERFQKLGLLPIDFDFTDHCQNGELAQSKPKEENAEFETVDDSNSGIASSFISKDGKNGNGLDKYDGAYVIAGGKDIDNYNAVWRDFETPADGEEFRENNSIDSENLLGFIGMPFFRRESLEGSIERDIAVHEAKERLESFYQGARGARARKALAISYSDAANNCRGVAHMRVADELVAINQKLINFRETKPGVWKFGNMGQLEFRYFPYTGERQMALSFGGKIRMGNSEGSFNTITTDNLRSMGWKYDKYDKTWTSPYIKNGLDLDRCIRMPLQSIGLLPYYFDYNGHCVNEPKATQDDRPTQYARMTSEDVARMVSRAVDRYYAKSV